MSGTAAILASNRAAPTPSVVSNFAKNRFDWETLLTTTAMPTGGSISRSGNAMQYDSTGKLTWAPNNLALYSQRMGTAPWGTSGGTVTVTEATSDTTAPDGTSTANKIMEVNAASTPRIAQSTTVPVGANVIISVYAKANGRSQIRIVAEGSAAKSSYFNLTGSGSTVGVGAFATANITSVGNGWYRCSIIYSAATTTQAYAATAEGGSVIASGDSTKGVFLWGYQVELVTWQTSPRDYRATTGTEYYAPRFDVDPATLQPKGLLVEGARTNLLTSTEAFSGWTVSANAALTQPSATNPAGGSTSALLTRGAATGSEAMLRVATTQAASTTYALSVYAKANTAGALLYVRNLAVDSATTSGVVTFALDGTNTITAGSSFTGKAAIQSVGNGWYRCSVYAATLASIVNNFIDIGCATSAGQVTGTAGASIYLFGAQLEAGAWASSYVPNLATTGTASRAAETFTLTGYANRLVEAYWIEQETGVASSFPETVVSSGAVTINPPQFGWVTSLRAYQNAYAGDITTPSWIDNSGTNGNRMVTDSTGTLTWAPANMLLQSQTFDNASWDKTTAPSSVTPDAATAPDGTSTADKIVEAANTNRHGVQQSVTLVNGNHIASVYAKAGERSFLQIGIWDGVGGAYLASFNLATGALGAVLDAGVSATITSAGNGWYRCSILLNVANAGAGTVRILATQTDTRFQSYLGDGTSGLFLWGAQLERVTYQTHPRLYLRTEGTQVYQPRYDFDATTTPASPRGMLIEETRTNILTNTQAFNNAAWALDDILAFGSGSVVDATTSPDGTATADLIVPNTVSSVHQVRTSSTVSASTAYTASVYIKPSGYTKVSIVENAITGAYATYNLSGSGSVVSTGLGGSGSVVAVGNGWYRVSMTLTTAVGQTAWRTDIRVLPNSYTSGAPSATWSGDGVSGVYVWGAMLEAGAWASSYVPNLASTGTSLRVADVVKWTSAAFSQFWNATQGTIALENRWLGSGSYVYATRASDGSASNTISLVSNSGVSGARIRAGAADQADLNSGVNLINATTRNVLAYKADDFAISVNGGAAVKDTAGSVPTVDQFVLSSGDRWIRSFAYYNRRLPDATLQQKSVVGAAY